MNKLIILFSVFEWIFKIDIFSRLSKWYLKNLKVEVDEKILIAQFLLNHRSKGYKMNSPIKINYLGKSIKKSPIIYEEVKRYDENGNPKNKKISVPNNFSMSIEDISNEY